MGDWVPSKKGEGGVSACYRKLEGESILVILNFTKRPNQTPLHGRKRTVLFSTHRVRDGLLEANVLTFAGLEATILEKVC